MARKNPNVNVEKILFTNEIKLLHKLKFELTFHD